VNGIEFLRGDITAVEADAIVNAANAALRGGGGVDGAIHRAGGPEILEACRAIGTCAPGSAVITGAGRLHARFVIHAVAPRYSGKPRDARLLRGAYATALELARQRGLASIAFPSLGTGAYGYPVAAAAPIALEAVAEHLSGTTSLRRVLFVLFSDEDLATYQSAAATLSVSRPAETRDGDVQS
jgi:O-acetyl-ADP-ribose deacetylase (regulator of RNase III)